MAVLHLGIQSLHGGVILRGSFAGSDDRCSRARSAVVDLARSTSSQRELVDGLRAIGLRHGMVVETGNTEPDMLGFYLWEADVAPVCGAAPPEPRWITG